MAVDLARIRALYPFAPKRFDRGGGIEMSYLDEGAGEPVVCVHGNPTWSFYFRELAKALRGSRRVIVPDHVGCGLSDKPGDEKYRYTLASRIDDLDALLNALGVAGGVSLILHDWGGAIGMGWAARHPERVARIVLMNTAAFGLPAGKRMPLALKLGRDSALGGALVRGLNAFARGTALVGCKKPLAPEIRRAYVSPYDSWANRIATLRFVQDIPLAPGDAAFEPLRQIEEALPRFRQTPALACWGMQDFVFDRHFLDEWRRRWPQAEVHEFAQAGHYVLEDEAEAIVPLVAEFLARPAAGASAP